MLVTIRNVSGTQIKFELDKQGLENLSKWIMDDNSSNVYSYQREYCDNSENVYNYEKQNHSCYIFKDKIESIDFSKD